jgi:nucleotide-binding universal stress UspA family protein
VVGVHGSRSSLHALQHAVDVARDRGWDLEIVTAWPDADDPLIHDVPGRYISPRGHAVECQRAALAALDPVVAADVDTFLINARPAEALICRGEGADLLVVGAGQPESELGRPSVAAACVEAAPCPVTVVPDSLEEVHGVDRAVPSRTSRI